jgi:light-regulated signal transduction histidine kinase (bacteriophytochrome)
MTTLINDLLDYSKIGTSKEMETIDCNALLEEVLSDLAIAIKEAGAAITVGRLPELRGHRTAIKQLFQNLVTNGIKFRKKDSTPVIKISAELNEACWQFSFADNGIGIERKNSEKIFVIFQRLHTRKEYEGSGIGLAHCKKIVEMHKGKIWLESQVERGTTFYFTIPFNKNS